MNTMFSGSRTSAVDIAIKDYEELKKTVDRYDGTFEDLCKAINGQHLDDDYFDVTYKGILVAVYKGEWTGGIHVSRYFEVLNADRYTEVERVKEGADEYVVYEDLDSGQ